MIAGTEAKALRSFLDIVIQAWKVSVVALSVFEEFKENMKL